MPVYLLALGLWLHAFFWGTGIGWLAMPRRWQKFWPLLALPSGFTLQSTVVWVGALLDLKGTNSYAGPAELIPLGLLFVALCRSSPARLARDLMRLGGVLAASVGTLLALVFPYAYNNHGLTTGSMGSCDAADYAGGARLFMEFARSDRTGFLGLTEVTRVMSIDHIFDFYLRLMHFTPCALVALNGTIFGLAPHELIGVIVALLLASAVPVVFLISRGLLEFAPLPSIGIALLFGFSPVNWYAVYQTAMAQLLAAQAIGVLTWASWCLWRFGASGGGRSYWGVLGIAFLLILGSYSFIIVVCLMPAVTFALGIALWKRQFERFMNWLLWILVPLSTAVLFFLLRSYSIVERLAVFKKYDEGWKIPYLWPEGWLGIVQEPNLRPIAEPFHSAAIGLLVAALVVTFAGHGRRRSKLLYSSACLAVPSLLACIFLYRKGINWGHNENRSYLAYKFFCVFYPGILPSLCAWMALAYRGIIERVFFLVLLGATLVGILRVDLKFEQLMVAPPLVVERELLDVRSVESMPQVTSLNMMIPDMWSRLWANDLLLEKPQYFPTHTYEGRLNTPLKGVWDLNGGPIVVTLPDGDSRNINESFSLINTRSPYFLRVSLGQGWHDPEHIQHRSIHWIWSKGDATLQFLNPHPDPMEVSLRFRIRSNREQKFEVQINGKTLLGAAIGPDIRVFEVPSVVLAKGLTKVELWTSLPPLAANFEDTRLLGFALFGLNVNVARFP
jgi:hypothetical protein